MDKVTVRSDKKIWEGWTKVEITRALKACAGEIRLSMTRMWNQAQPINVEDGLPVQIYIGNDRVATGYVSEFIPSYDAKTVSYELICHDKTIDLVECSVVHPSGQWDNIRLETLATEVCKPFGIEVVTEADTGEAFKTVRLEQGETGFELLERLSRQRGVLLTSNEYGNLVITSASKQRLNTRLKLGENILAARGRFSMRERHSEVIVKGDAGWVTGDSSEAGGQSVTEVDSGVVRYRPQILLMEEVYTAEGASRRGKWQIANAIAKGVNTEITVAGWRSEKNFTGPIWPVNKLVPVIDPIQSLNKDMLIASISLVENEEGRVTVLGMVPPEAMEIGDTKIGKVKQGWRDAKSA